MLFPYLFLSTTYLYHLINAQYTSEENGAPSSKRTTDFHQYFELAKRDYLDGAWVSCVDNVLNGLEDFEHYSNDLSHCHYVCSQYDSFELDGVLKKGLCSKKCRKETFKSRNVTVEDVRDYVGRKPYEFLHVCAFRMGNVPLAASAAYTHFLANKNDQVMVGNIQFYRQQPNITVSDFKNLEESAFVMTYIDGAIAYSNQVWVETAELMELAISLFYSDYTRCEALCEETERLETRLSFHQALAERHISVMRCSEACFTRLTEIRGKVIADVLSDMYNYLQFAYFKLKRLHEALQCADTFLLFRPEDEDMINNRNYYVASGAVTTAPRQEAVWFHAHLSRLATILADVDENHDDSLAEFGIPKNLMVARSYPDPVSGLPRPQTVTETETCSKDTCESEVLEVDTRNKMLVASRVIPEKDIEGLLEAMKQFSLKRSIRNVTVSMTSDNGDVTPSVGVENMYDLNIDRIVLLHRIGKLSLASLRLVLSAADRMKRLVDLHLTTGASYVRELNIVRTQVKHDNTTTIPLESVPAPCLLQETGWCPRKGAHQNDSILIVLYLNQDFTGGQLMLENFMKNSKRTFQPVRGHVVGFHTFNDHVVSALQPGDRYAVFLALTAQEGRRNVGYAQATALARYPARRQQSATEQVQSQPKNSEESRAKVVQGLMKEGVSVEEIGPWDRFQADGLADQNQCQMLMDLARVAQKNDGYSRGKEVQLGMVHTEHEFFSGITIDAAAKLAERSEVGLEYVTLYQRLAEWGKEVVHRYFQLATPLYFDYTHLVCRTARNDSNKERDDLSHPVHSDNCIIYADGSCRKESPAYTERDYSALLYLNDDFEGGEFVFTNPKPVGMDEWFVEAEVRPRCGRLVGFRAEDYHGVRAVVAGRRCALAMWFTLDPYYREKAHTEARKIMAELKTATKTATDGGGGG